MEQCSQRFEETQEDKMQTLSYPNKRYYYISPGDLMILDFLLVINELPRAVMLGPTRSSKC